MHWGDAVLAFVAFAFAWSMGAHYTGACMGMPYATGSIRLWPALGAMAVFTLVGATFLSHKVLVNVGHHILVTDQLGRAPAIIIVGSAFVLTTIFNWQRIPTSTIQILVFCVIGVGIALGMAIRWRTILHLAVLWIIAPFVACALGYLLTKLFDLFTAFTSSGTAGAIGRALVTVGAAASLTMGANDVSNATAVFLTTRLSGPLVAGLIGGAGLALGVLTWGRPLLERVAFDVVKMDMAMATAAQLVQALVVLTAVFFGYFTSMNQALIGAMVGAGLARGRETIDRKVMLGILRGWIIGPAAGILIGYTLTKSLTFA